MNRSTRRKRSHPGRSGTAPTAAPSSPGPGGFNVSAGIFLCPVPNFAGVLRARAGCGDAGEGGCRPERGGGGGPRGPAAPTTPLNERFALKNTRATFRKRGWGCPPASQSGRPLLPPPGTPAGTGRVGECGGLCSFYRTPPPPLRRSRSVAGASTGGGGERVRPAGAAYRGATPRGARGSTTRCRGRQRRGRPGSRPAVPRSCGGKEDTVRERAPTTTTSASRPRPLPPHWYRQRHRPAPASSHPRPGTWSPLCARSKSLQPSELAPVSRS